MTNLDLARNALHNLQSNPTHDRTLAAKLALALLEAEAARTTVAPSTSACISADRIVARNASISSLAMVGTATTTSKDAACNPADAAVNGTDAAGLRDAVDRVAVTLARAPDTSCIQNDSRA